MTVRVNTSQFRRRASKVAPMLKVSAGAAIKVIIDQFKDDCLGIPPSCPEETGNLKNAHRTETSVVGSRARGSLIVDTMMAPYAWVLHSGISRWETPFVYKTPGAGSHWISSKAVMFRNKYLKTADAVFKSSLKGI